MEFADITIVGLDDDRSMVPDEDGSEREYLILSATPPDGWKEEFLNRLMIGPEHLVFEAEIEDNYLILKDIQPYGSDLKNTLFKLVDEVNRHYRSQLENEERQRAQEEADRQAQQQQRRQELEKIRKILFDK